MRKAFLTFFVFLVVGLVSCVSSTRNTKPGWIQNSGVSGKVSGIGICGTHVNGPNAQRALAIKRAIDEIALQLGVKVNNVALIGTKASAAGASTTVESYSFQTVDGNVVKAVIRETWSDPQTDEIYIWMVTE